MTTEPKPKHAIQVGGVYDPRRRTWPEGAAWTHHDGWELLLRIAAPTPPEVAAVASGPASLAILLAGAVAIGLYRFGEGGRGGELPAQADPIPWSDVPLEPHGWERLPASEEQAVFCVVLIDAGTGIVRALRVVRLAPQFTAAMRGASLAARAAYTTPEAYVAGVAAAVAKPSEVLAALAPNLTQIPAKRGR